MNRIIFALLILLIAMIACGRSMEEPSREEYISRYMVVIEEVTPTSLATPPVPLLPLEKGRVIKVWIEGDRCYMTEDKRAYVPCKSLEPYDIETPIPGPRL